jgi:hypothetical protein
MTKTKATALMSLLLLRRRLLLLLLAKERRERAKGGRARARRRSPRRRCLRPNVFVAVTAWVGEVLVAAARRCAHCLLPLYMRFAPLCVPRCFERALPVVPLSSG